MRYAVPADGAALSFNAWLDQESADPLTLKVSADGGNAWVPTPFALRDRGTTIHGDHHPEFFAALGWVQTSR